MKYYQKYKLILLFVVIFTTALMNSTLTSSQIVAANQMISQSDGVIIDVTDYGAIPNSEEDAAVPVQRALAEAIEIDGPVIINFPAGTYHFYSELAEKRPYYISNTTSESENPDITKTIGLLLKDLSNVTIEGNDSLFILHGKMTTFVIDQSENIEIRNVSVDYERPTISEVKVVELGSNYIDVEVNQDSLYEIRSNKVVWVSEDNQAGGKYWEFSGGIAQEFDPERNITWRINNPFTATTNVEEIAPSKLRLTFNQRPNTKVGNYFQMRDSIRTQVGGFVHRSKDVSLVNVNMHFMHGLGIVRQYSENLTLDTVTFAPRTETGRTAAAFADFIQASGMKGMVKVINSTFSGSHDDVINVHGTHLRVQE